MLRQKEVLWPRITFLQLLNLLLVFSLVLLPSFPSSVIPFLPATLVHLLVHVQLRPEVLCLPSVAVDPAPPATPAASVIPVPLIQVLLLQLIPPFIPLISFIPHLYYCSLVMNLHYFQH